MDFQHILERRPIERGVSIDNNGAEVLDDAFIVNQYKDGSFLLKFFIADPSIYYDRVDQKPDLVSSRGNTGLMPNIPAEVRRKQLSLHPPTQDEDEYILRPAIMLEIPFDADGNRTELPKISKVAFQNIKAYVHKEFSSFETGGDQKAPKDFKQSFTLAKLLNRNAIADKIDHMSPHDNIGSFIVEKLSAAANEAMTAYADANDVPIIYQNASVSIKENDSNIYNAHDAREHIKKIYPTAKHKRNMSVAFKNNFVEFATTVKGNILQGYSKYSRATSPLQSILDCYNLINIGRHVSNPKNPRYYGKRELDKIIDGTNGRDNIHTIIQRNRQQQKSEDFNRRAEDEQTRYAIHLTELLSSPQKLKICGNFERTEFINSDEVRTDPDLYKEHFNVLTSMIKDAMEHDKTISVNFLEEVLCQPEDKKLPLTKEVNALKIMALNYVANKGLSEMIIRRAVERSGTYDAFFFHNRRKGDYASYQPVIISNGVQLSCPDLMQNNQERMKDLENDPEDEIYKKMVNSSFYTLLKAITEDRLVGANDTKVHWPKKMLKTLERDQLIARARKGLVSA